MLARIRQWWKRRRRNGRQAISEIGVVVHWREPPVRALEVRHEWEKIPESRR